MATLILLNKPFNVLCQFTDQKGRATLADFVEEKNVYPAGRLDYDSEGLLALTNDGALQHQISHPSAKLSKTYWAQVEGQPTTDSLEQLRQGITLSDGPCKPAKVTLITTPKLWPRSPPVRERKNIPTSWLELTITEGRNRQARRMTAAVGHPTLRLIRVKIGNWSLDHLQPGESTKLTIHSASDKSRHNKRTTGRRRRL